jgi:predicted NBD/HSP70 family sugar kinase
MKGSPLVRSSIVIDVPNLTDSARAVLRTVASQGPSTRPQLSAALSFSKPTMSAAVTELERHGLVAPAGINQGAVGRSSITYGLGESAGIVIGIDCGTTQIHAIACTLNGASVTDVEMTIGALSGVDRFRLIEGVLEETLLNCGDKAQFLRSVVIAVPNMISTSLERLRERQAFLDVVAVLHRKHGVPILLENNVNCAALAEYHQGAAKDHSFAIYMQIGVKVGVGIVISGKLFGGFKGGAGEIGHLPFPWSERENPRSGHVETYLGSAALLERVAAQWPTSEGQAPKTTSELIAMATTSPTARAIVQGHAEDIGYLAAACVSVLDPELIVLGGGVGQNPILLSGVRRTVESLCWPVEVVVSQLSGRATVLGAARLAMDFSLARLLGENVRTAFLYTGEPAEASAAAVR